jgi:hypothetical protein
VDVLIETVVRPFEACIIASMSLGYRISSLSRKEDTQSYRHPGKTRTLWAVTIGHTLSESLLLVVHLLVEPRNHMIIPELNELVCLD